MLFPGLEIAYLRGFINPQQFLIVTICHMAMRLRSLAIELSKLESIIEKNIELEQYQTEGELAARWSADILAFIDIFEGCRVADLG